MILSTIWQYLPFRKNANAPKEKNKIDPQAQRALIHECALILASCVFYIYLLSTPLQCPWYIFKIEAPFVFITPLILSSFVLNDYIRNQTSRTGLLITALNLPITIYTAIKITTDALTYPKQFFPAVILIAFALIYLKFVARRGWSKKKTLGSLAGILGFRLTLLWLIYKYIYAKNQTATTSSSTVKSKGGGGMIGEEVSGFLRVIYVFATLYIQFRYVRSYKRGTWEVVGVVKYSGAERIV